MDISTRRSGALAAALAAVLLLPALLEAQTSSPNLSGTWKMDAERSVLPQSGRGGSGGRSGRGGSAGGGGFPDQMVITHEGSKITLKWTQQMGRSGSQEVTQTFTTDGKPTENESPMGKSTVKSEWKNGMLIVTESRNSEAAGQTRTQTTTTTYTLGGDGKSLLRFVDMGMRGGQLVSANIVYTKIK
jgi:hypothetical protein